MKISNRYKEAFERAKESPAYWTESALLDVARALLDQMKRLGVTQKTLAERMGRKAPYVNRVLSGRHNVTVETLSEAAHALDMRLKIELQPKASAAPRSILSVTADMDGFVPRDGVVVKSRRLTLIHGANETFTSAPTFDTRKAA
ncbi:helix-turn-helix domain-containing protein [Paraburkholderia strydomiana]|uniref:helix-turn-helix domain-containing protein n=1 Tax=Paraburkholderia strydomiana TaxID=1245417 RepID=UPI00285C3338|nr:helix-turn-helix transcriptional regulator [Paraburkholderia strydomiana]MDR7006056.1 transcriptional regulator with XRE-family HTH domain [Paraburkholderia strydomiana]